jgi:hypothetical protein
MNNYIDDKIFGLPAPLKKGGNTSPTSARKDKEYIFKVEINGNKYYKVHINRQRVSKIKYFKRFKQAKLFVAMLRENKYL